MSTPHERGDSGNWLSRWVRAGAAGVVGAFSMYGLVFAFSIQTVLNRGTATTPEGTLTSSLFPPAWKVVAWAAYGVHHVKIGTLSQQGDRASTLPQFLVWIYGGHDIIAAVPVVPIAGRAFNWAELLLEWPIRPGIYLVPPVVLVTVGFVAVRREESLRNVLVAMTGLVSGYAAVMAGGAFLVRDVVHAFGATVTLGPDLSTAIAAGMLYPLVFGTVGGAIAYGDIRKEYRALIGRLPRFALALRDTARRASHYTSPKNK